MNIPRSLRLLLALIALALVVFALAALAFAFWPAEVVRVQATLAPGMFTPP
jgi:hypothetical protein